VTTETPRVGAGATVSTAKTLVKVAADKKDDAKKPVAKKVASKSDGLLTAAVDVQR